MTNTESIQTIGIMAARINRGDTVEIDGEWLTVDDYETLPGRIVWTFTDGTTRTVAPHRYITAVG